MSRRTDTLRSYQPEMERLARIESPNPIFCAAADGSVSYSNVAGKSILADWNGSSGGSVPDEVIPSIVHCLQENTDCKIEIVSPKGRRISCIIAPQHENGLVTIYARDVTEQHRVKKEWDHALDALELRVKERTAELEAANRVLRQSEERLRIALKNAPISMSMTDRNLRYTWLHLHSSAAPDVQKFIGKRAESFLPPDDAGRLDGLRKRVIESGHGAREEMLLHIGGEAIEFDVLVEPFRNKAGEIEGVTTVSLDITERKRAENRLMDLNSVLERRAEQLRNLTNELTRAEERERRRIAEILHDQMQQLLVAAKFSLGGLYGRVNDTSIRSALDEIGKLIDDTITASRSLTSELAPPMLYERGLPEALQSLSHWMREKHGIEVFIEVHPRPKRLPQEIRVMLFQGIRELLLNVVKHAKVKRAAVGLSYGPDNITVRVQDEGPGFEPLAVSEGFGLIALRERLSAFDGQLSIESAPGHGTVVTIGLSVQFEETAEVEEFRVASATAKAAPTTKMAGDHRRVLLADDHTVMRQGLIRLLREFPGIEIVGEANDGQQAVELTKLLHPDVVIMDINMARMDGIEATRILQRELPDVRVVGLSMYHNLEAVRAMTEAGAAAYLPKDTPIENLLSAICDIGEREQDSA